MTATEKSIKLVVFDLAGTLVDCGSSAPVRAFRALFADYEVPLSESQVRQFMGMGKRDHIRSMLELDEVAERWAGQHGKRPGEAEIDMLYADYLPRQEVEALRARDPVPGALEVLRDLTSRGVRCATNTGYSRVIAEPIVESLRGAGVPIEVAIYNDDVPTGRPAPGMIELAMRESGITDRSLVVHCGDTPMDVQSGGNAKVWSLAVTLTGSGAGLSAAAFAALGARGRKDLHLRLRPPLVAAGAHAVLPDLSSLPGTLIRIDDRLGQGHGPSELPNEWTAP